MIKCFEGKALVVVFWGAGLRDQSLSVALSEVPKSGEWILEAPLYFFNSFRCNVKCSDVDPICINCVGCLIFSMNYTGSLGCKGRRVKGRTHKLSCKVVCFFFCA